jgi:hypothetical protein
MKKFLIILIAIAPFLISNPASGLEATWENLKTLEIDVKTKKPIIKDQLKKLVGKEVSIKGFMMPLDFEAKEIVEFLFMPYVPSCMHVPPPPPNQLILVKMKKGTKVKSTYYPMELTGKLSVDSNSDLESSFKIEGTKAVELKDYTPPPGPKPVGGI